MGDSMKKNKLPVWDLSEFYKSVDDVNIDKDIKKYEKKINNNSSFSFMFYSNAGVCNC